MEYLDVSFNSLTTLEGLRSLPRLKHLDVSWNELTCYRDAIGVMRRHTPAIQVLHIENNPWNKVTKYYSNKTFRRLVWCVIVDCTQSSEFSLLSPLQIYIDVCSNKFTTVLLNTVSLLFMGEIFTHLQKTIVKFPHLQYNILQKLSEASCQLCCEYKSGYGMVFIWYLSNKTK